jgi:hypothetical protein
MAAVKYIFLARQVNAVMLSLTGKKCRGVEPGPTFDQSRRDFLMSASLKIRSLPVVNILASKVTKSPGTKPGRARRQSFFVRHLQKIMIYGSARYILDKYDPISGKYRFLPCLQGIIRSSQNLILSGTFSVLQSAASKKEYHVGSIQRRKMRFHVQACLIF